MFVQPAQRKALGVFFLSTESITPKGLYLFKTAQILYFLKWNSGLTCQHISTENRVKEIKGRSDRYNHFLPTNKTLSSRSSLPTSGSLGLSLFFISRQSMARKSSNPTVQHFHKSTCDPSHLKHFTNHKNRHWSQSLGVAAIFINQTSLKNNLEKTKRTKPWP